MECIFVVFWSDLVAQLAVMVWLMVTNDSYLGILHLISHQLLDDHRLNLWYLWRLCVRTKVGHAIWTVTVAVHHRHHSLELE